eukprot:TRINITY_DN11629_c0_g1_i1.p1 TRINITY_DN11629_c0_g1~~TRINITY_DN11629_c0_g1_i1.p1  ORF type:complete len:55 (-),score=8.33 TRINITY_DN11629_c0_g1_i1:176-340(-)
MGLVFSHLTDIMRSCYTIEEVKDDEGQSRENIQAVNDFWKTVLKEQEQVSQLTL